MSSFKKVVVVVLIQFILSISLHRSKVLMFFFKEVSYVHQAFIYLIKNCNNVKCYYNLK